MEAPEEPTNAELASASVEDSAEPTNAELAGAASSIATFAAVPEDSESDETEESAYGAGSYVGTEPPSGYDIKGNADSMKFHTPESPYYTRTVAEVWFSSVEAARSGRVRRRPG